MIFNSLRDHLCRFRAISQWSKIGRFWAKSLGYSPWFWTWRIFEGTGNRSKLSETPPEPFKMTFNSLRDRLFRLRAISQGSKIGRFLAKTLGYSPWFWTWRIFESTGNRSKLSQTPPEPFKMIFNSLRDRLCRFLAISQGSKIGRFWAKTLGCSPWFWTWQIFEGTGNRSKLSETPPEPWTMTFNSLRDRLCRFRAISQGSKIGRFWAKTLGYSPWFWTWRIFESTGNRSKLSETPPETWTMIFNSLRDCLCRFWAISQGSKSVVFEQRPGAIAHGFEHGGFSKVLEIAPNSLKRLLNLEQWFLTLSATVCVDFGRFRKGRKSAVF